MSQNHQIIKLLRLLSRNEKVELQEDSAVLSCPNCRSTILRVFINNNIIQYNYNQMLAEDGAGIEPSKVTKNADSPMHLDGEILTGYCRSCNAPYFLFDMFLSQDKIFAFDNTSAWRLPEESDLIKESPKQMVYNVTINGEQIGILEEFKDMPWKTGQGTLYLFESRLFSVPDSFVDNEDENILYLNSLSNDIKELCTSTFIKIREVVKSY